MSGRHSQPLKTVVTILWYLNDVLYFLLIMVLCTFILTKFIPEPDDLWEVSIGCKPYSFRTFSPDNAPHLRFLTKRGTANVWFVWTVAQFWQTSVSPETADSTAAKTLKSKHIQHHSPFCFISNLYFLTTIQVSNVGLWFEVLSISRGG